MTLRYLEYEVCAEFGFRYQEFAALPKRERVRLLAFLGVKGQIKRYMASGALLDKAGISLEEWLGLSEEARKMKLKFAQNIKGQ